MNEFHTLVIQTRCTILLVHGDHASYSIDENGEKANWVNVSVTDNRLTVYTKPEHYGYLLLHGCYPQITITYKTLTGLKMLDRCFVKSADTLILQQIGIIVREGHLDLSVDAFLIDCTVFKRGYAKLSGEAIISRVLAHQRSIYEGLELEASEGNVHVHDEAFASVLFTEELELGLFGRSKVDYAGNPRMKILQIDEGCSIKSLTE